MPPTPRLLQQADGWQSDFPAAQHLIASKSNLKTMFPPARTASLALTPQDSGILLTLKTYGPLTELFLSRHQSLSLSKDFPSSNQLALQGLSPYQTAAANFWCGSGLIKVSATIGTGQQPAWKHPETLQQMLHEAGIGHLAMLEAKALAPDGAFTSVVGNPNRTQQKLPIRIEAAKSSDTCSQSTRAGGTESSYIVSVAAASALPIMDNHSSKGTQQKLYTESQVSRNAALAEQTATAKVTKSGKLDPISAASAMCHGNMQQTRQWHQQNKNNQLLQGTPAPHCHTVACPQKFEEQ